MSFGNRQYRFNRLPFNQNQPIDNQICPIAHVQYLTVTYDNDWDLRLDPQAPFSQLCRVLRIALLGSSALNFQCFGSRRLRGR